MQKIFVPLDGSELSERAIPLGVLMARAFDVELELFHVLTSSSPFGTGNARERRLAARRYLDALAGGISAGVDVSVHVAAGDPHGHLEELVALEPDAMVAMATHARSGLKRLALGSVADNVVRGALVPVALVRGDAMPIGAELRTMLVPLDGSEPAEAVLPLVEALAVRTGARVTLTQVIDPYWEPVTGAWPSAGYEPVQPVQESPPELQERLLRNVRSYMEKTAHRLRKAGVRADWEVRVGAPSSEIMRASETTQADFVAMATHGRGGYRRWALGSVMHDILQHGTTPLLVVPRGPVSSQNE